MRRVPPVVLPIDERIPAIVGSLRAEPCLVLRAPPGAGKTTRVPPALLDQGIVGPGREVVVLEPRRLAALMAARRVADERGLRLGEEVGYRVRFESMVSASTRLCYQTEGILWRMLLADPALERVGAVVLDEFHERSAEADLALALLRDVRETVRPDLRVVVMSATLEPGRIARFLGGCPVIETEGRRWPVEIAHDAGREGEPLEARVAAGLRRFFSAGLEGSVLVFVPGAAEIRRTIEAVSSLAAAQGHDVLPLHGDLPLEEQDRAVRPGDRPRVIVATNLAEASITVEGVEAVIDSGLARVSRHDPRTELNRLVTTRISRASAQQRAGRAGRTAPGRCLRLYGAAILAASPEEDEPEIRRIELSDAALRLLAWGVGDPLAYAWLDPPEPARMERALRLLEWLGAAGPPPGEQRGWRLTALGRELLRYPLPPRQARILVEGERRGCLEAAAPVVALLAERDLRLSARALAGAPPAAAERRASSDLLERADDLEAAARLRFDPRSCAAIGLDARAARRARRAADQLLRIGRPRGRARAARMEDALLAAIAAGYPDRVVRRRGAGSAEGLMVGGAGVRLDPGSAVRDAEHYVALDAAPEKSAGVSFVRVRAASAVRPERLLELFPGLVREEESAAFDAREERVAATRRTLFLDLPLFERETGGADPEVAAEALFAAVLRDPDRAIAIDAGLLALLQRLRWLLRLRGALPLPETGIAEAEIGAAPGLRAGAGPLAPHLLSAVRALCSGRRSFADLRAAPLLERFRSVLPAETARLLEALAPERCELPSGRAARLVYGEDEAPVLAARLQEFFGSEATPRVGGGRVAVRLHLLAPSQRPVQVTQDLASFWRNAYPRVRSELRRRYPRHAWPEDPLAAAPERSPGRRGDASAASGGAGTGTRRKKDRADKRRGR